MNARTSLRRVTATVGAVATAFALLAAVPAAAAPARPTATVTTPDGGVTTSTPVTVTVTTTRRSPVTVTFGDGKVTRVTCPTVRSCTRSVDHVYTNAGSFPLTVTARVPARKKNVLLARQVTVTAPTPEPTPTPTPTPTPAPTPSPTAAPVDGWMTDMLASVNSVRAAAGAGPLTLCAPLSQAAQAHSADMAARDYFSHVSPEGAGPGNRIAATGFRTSGWGENIAAGNSTVGATMDQWINSPGHYANMVNPRFTLLGVGKANGGAYGTYWTQVFGAGSC